MTEKTCRELLEAAHQELCDAFKRQWNGKPAFNATIPADESRDTDLIIGAGLRAGMTAEQQVEELRDKHAKTRATLMRVTAQNLAMRDEIEKLKQMLRDELRRRL